MPFLLNIDIFILIFPSYYVPLICTILTCFFFFSSSLCFQLFEIVFLFPFSLLCLLGSYIFYIHSSSGLPGFFLTHMISITHFISTLPLNNKRVHFFHIPIQFTSSPCSAFYLDYQSTIKHWKFLLVWILSIFAWYYLHIYQYICQWFLLLCHRPPI